MSTPKRFYWIKLRESFMNGDVVDFLMSQKDGANYVVLYQMLCLKTINTEGRLSRQIGEIIIPFDAEKIQRDCKWFSIDTIRVALKLYQACGLIYEDRDGTLVLADHANLVGSETSWAAQKRNQRSLPQELPGGHCPPPCPQGVPETVHPDIRDIENRDKEIREERLDTRDRDGGGCSNPYVDADHQHRRPSFNTLEVYATSNLRFMSPYNLEELVSFRDTLPDDVIRYAIDEACANGCPEYSYTRSILNRYVKCGFKSIGDVKTHEAQRKDAQQNKAAGSYDYSQDDDKGW